MLAGISAEYYLRLERGRAQHPSPQILDALARALKLDIKATKYLHQLASPTTSRWDQSVLEVAAEGLDRLIDQCPFPAIVASRYQDVLAANPIARALSPGFAPGQNFLRWRLLDPAARKLYVDWDEATDAAVSGLRECAGIDPHDPRMQKLIAELSDGQPTFPRTVGARRCGLPVGNLAHASSAGRPPLSLPEPAQRSACSARHGTASAHLSRRPWQRLRQSAGGTPGPRDRIRGIADDIARGSAVYVSMETVDLPVHATVRADAGQGAGQGARRSGGVVLRAEVGRLPGAGVPRRRRRGRCSRATARSSAGTSRSCCDALRDELAPRCVLDGEVVVPREIGGRIRLDWESLSQRIHPAASRVKMLAEQTPGAFHRLRRAGHR